MSDEPTYTDADDGDARQKQARLGVLTDEVSGRHLRYRRAVEAHQEVLQHELVEVQATAYATTELHPDGSNPLAVSWRSVKEARSMYDAARQVLREHKRSL